VRALRAVRRPPAPPLFHFRLLAASLGGLAAVFAGCAVACLPRRLRERWLLVAVARTARLACRGAGIRVESSGTAHARATLPCVLVANHQSYLDYGIFADAVPERTVVIGQTILGRIPLVAWAFRRGGNVVVERGEAGSRRAALAALEDAVRAGRSVWVFPEGTRNRRAPGTLLPFNRGAFHVAVACGVPVVPVVAEALAPRTDVAARRLERRSVRVRVLEPVLPDGRDATALMHDVRARMEAALASLPG
jgi:1-acyl-sn-glycerol-3-phosphate acyltransferase